MVRNGSADYGVTHNVLPQVAFRFFEYTMWFDVGASQGPRTKMEDRWSAHMSEDGQTIAFVVFDGHGGDEVAEDLAKTLSMAIFAEGDLHTCPKEVIKRVFAREDERITAPLGKDILGSTAVLALFLPGKLVVANVGDSRAVVICGEGGSCELRITHLTEDQRPGVPGENERLQSLARQAGTSAEQVVEFDQVRGDLAVSRAFGNPGLKDVVKADPAVFEVELKGLRKVVLVSDGITDVVDNDGILHTVMRPVATPDFDPQELERLLKVEAKLGRGTQPQGFLTPSNSFKSPEGSPERAGSSELGRRGSDASASGLRTPLNQLGGGIPLDSPCTPPWGTMSQYHGRMLVELAVERRCRDNLCAMVVHIDPVDDYREPLPPNAVEQPALNTWDLSAQHGEQGAGRPPTLHRRKSSLLGFSLDLPDDGGEGVKWPRGSGGSADMQQSPLPSPAGAAGAGAAGAGAAGAGAAGGAGGRPSLPLSPVESLAQSLEWGGDALPNAFPTRLASSAPQSSPAPAQQQDGKDFYALSAMLRVGGDGRSGEGPWGGAGGEPMSPMDMSPMGTSAPSGGLFVTSSKRRASSTASPSPLVTRSFEWSRLCPGSEGRGWGEDGGEDGHEGGHEGGHDGGGPRIPIKSMASRNSVPEMFACPPMDIPSPSHSEDNLMSSGRRGLGEGGRGSNLAPEEQGGGHRRGVAKKLTHVLSNGHLQDIEIEQENVRPHWGVQRRRTRDTDMGGSEGDA